MARKVLMMAVVGLCAALPAQGKPAQVILIRHAEKPPEGNELSQKGRERAAALAPYFLGRPEVVQFKTPVAIYAQGLKKEDSCADRWRPYKALAAALKLAVIDKYTHDEFPRMVEEILSRPEYDGKMVLICWEHKAIPDMARAFGVKKPPEWPGAVFDRTWIITFSADKKPSLASLPQKLMYGDSAD